ncbi:MAG TPA: DMT family transporter [Anaerolineae bacterium]|nr:DMT family transporter [Anaerolineae bacterium]HOR00897.1 DMT family transporter [Anaerolineae bacterium]HPL29796.1 DMT family transporter [Anaerolineae bacterium]
MGIALGLGAAVVYAGYITARGRIMRQVPAIPASTVIIASAALVYAGLVAIQGPSLPATSAGWLAIVGLALVSTVLAIVTFLAGLERVGATTAAMVSTVEPAVTVVLAALVLGEAISASIAAGGVLILAAVLIVTRSELGKGAAPARSPTA